MIETVLLVALGLFAGSVVNMLADELPYRRRPGIPVYPDGTPRSLSAWSGILAFLTGARSPRHAQPDPTRARPHSQDNRLSWRYPLTELLTIGLMLIAFYALQSHQDIDALQVAFILLYMAIFTLITVIDMEHKLILFVVIIPSVLIGLIDSLVTAAQPTFLNALAGGALGFGAFYLAYQGGFLFNYLAGRMRGKKITTTAFGYGDVMMITLSGVLLGFAGVFLAIFITVFLGAFGAIVYLIAKKLLVGKYNAFTAIPYGPYIVAATIIMMLFGSSIQKLAFGY
jgi:leader peptidase (prepilin peptidase) / N-methyltransferase